MREKTVEQALVKAVKSMGGRAYKFVSPGASGVPDRIVMFPGGCIGFVEVKAPGKELRELQKISFMKLRAWGFKVFLLDGVDQIDAIIAEIREGNEKEDDVEGDME